MKDLSLFLVKNTLASRMKKSFTNLCNGTASTSTLNQRNDRDVAPTPLTLEQMILQLDMEEEAARRAKFDEYGQLHRRMSCVNNYDILTSARNALNQYPRFSLDGKDAMYRSSFRNFQGGRRSVCGGAAGGNCGAGRMSGGMIGAERGRRLPGNVGGESVVWCKPGIVAKLMGLDAVPVPLRPCRNKGTHLASRKDYARSLAKHELQKERLCKGVYGYNGCRTGWESTGSCSTSSYCVMNPLSVEPPIDTTDWHFSRPR